MTFAVVVAWREGSAQLRRCLEALIPQGADQVIVSRPSNASDAELASEFPSVEWVEVGEIQDLPEVFWRAMSQVRCDLVATLEAPSVPEPGWLRRLRAAHQERSLAFACGGSVRLPSGETRAWVRGWYWTDYSTCTPAQAVRETGPLSDANVSYKTGLLKTYADSMRSGAWGWRIREAADLPCAFEPAAIVEYPPPARLSDALAARRVAGRLHATTGPRGIPSWAFRIVVAPAVVVMLFGKDLAAALRWGGAGTAVRSAPWIVLFRSVWEWGVVQGLMARPHR